MDAWKQDPLYRPFYHPTGFIMAACGDEAYQKCLEYAENEKTELFPLKTSDDFHSTMPEKVLTGSFPGWRGFWKKEGAGWVFAKGALKAMYEEAVELGVKFVTGPEEGEVTTMLYSDAGYAVVGARTTNDSEYIADQTILAAGANSDLLLDFKKQLRPTAWTLAHLPLSIDEVKRYQNLPVLYGVDRGFFIEPGMEHHEIKICDEHPGYVNMVKTGGQLRSIPFARKQIPVEAEARMRRLLRETMPQFEHRNFSFARICWDADTVDRVFLIDRHPEINNLIVAVGGSGNGFMTCPAIGIIVADIVEGKLEYRLQKMMRWRPEIAENRNWWDTQGRFGADGKIVSFKDVREWTNIV
jgi:sarcosine oxidase/L-pipecolate oxidase